VRQSGSSRASAFDEFSTALRFLKVKTVRLDRFVYCEEEIATRPFNASTALPSFRWLLNIEMDNVHLFFGPPAPPSCKRFQKLPWDISR
jgi:hypothetical protein